MKTYTEDQIRQALYDLFDKNNAIGKPRKTLTASQHYVLGVVTIAIQDYDKKQATTPTPQ